MALILLVGGAWSSAACLATGVFVSWTLVPIGASYLAMLPLPCYFKAVTSTRARHAARNVLFFLVAVFFLGIGFGILPLSWMGL